MNALLALIIAALTPGIEPLDLVEPHWLELADCESGNWTDTGHEPQSARWDWGHNVEDLPPWGSTLNRGQGVEAQFHGGLQFHPDTWTWVAGDLGVADLWPHAYQAPAAVQIWVAEETQARQGWEAWPVCSKRVGLR